MAAYGTFVSNTPQVIATGGPVNLNAALPATPVGMTFTPGASTVTITAAGVYHVKYSIRTAVGTGATMQLLQNGVAVPNSGLVALAVIGEISGVAILTAAAGDTIAIGTAGAGVTLVSGINALLDIMQIA